MIDNMKSFHFKPEFGNERHIRIVEEIGKLGEMSRMHDEYLKHRKQVVLLKKKIKDQEAFIQKLIDFGDK